jgi:drug/metabolite transporter (DMT)-like permease
MVRKKHAPLFILASLSIGIASILVRVSGASSVACAFWRLFIASLMLMLVSSVGCRRVLHWKALVYPLIAGFALSMHFVLWMDSLFKVSVAVSTTVVVLYPAHLMLVEVLRGEKVGYGAVAGLLIAFAAVVLLFSKSLVVKSMAEVLGIVEAFIASLAAALYFFIGRASRRSMTTAEYATTTYFTASLITLAYSLAIGDNVFSYLPASWPWLLALAVVPMLGGHTVMNYLLRFYKSSTVTSIALAEPVVASILASIILNERTGLVEVVALAMAITGVALVLKESKD